MWYGCNAFAGSFSFCSIPFTVLMHCSLRFSVGLRVVQTAGSVLNSLIMPKRVEFDTVVLWAVFSSHIPCRANIVFDALMTAEELVLLQSEIDSTHRD